MIDSIFYIILIIEIYLFARIEYLKWGTLVTPFNMLALLFGVVTSLAIVYSYSNSGVKEFYFPSLIVWITGLAVFYLPACLIHVRPNRYKQAISLKEKGDDLYILLYGITLLFLVISLYKIRSVGGGTTLGTDEFSEEYGASGGAFAHISIFLSMMFAYFFCKFDKKHKLALIPIILILLTTVAQASKTHILSPILMGFFARVITGRTHLSLKIVVIIALASVGVFFGIYYISLVLSGVTDSKDVYFEFVSHHFLVYFLGGPLSFSLDYQCGILEPDKTLCLIAPFVRVWEIISGESIKLTIANPIFLNMGELGETNVRTFFGTLYAYSHSYSVLILLSLFVSILVYSVYYLSYVKKNIFLTIATSSNLTYLVLGSFFDFYWIHIYPYEIVIICLILYLICSISNGIKYKKASATA